METVMLVNENCKVAIEEFSKINNEIVWLKNYTHLFNTITYTKDDTQKLKDFNQLSEINSYIFEFFKLFTETQDRIPTPF